MFGYLIKSRKRAQKSTTLVFMLLLLCILVETTSRNNSYGYSFCQGLSYRFDGYTYTQLSQTGPKLWTHCSIPNPFSDHQRCGRLTTKGKHYICDPDRLVTNEEIMVDIESRLRELRRRTSTMCVNSRGESESFIVAVAIIDRILIPDLQHPGLCSNECGRLEPNLDLTKRYPTDSEQEEIMRNFADNLRREWSLGSCDNDVIVVYCKELNKVHVSAGLKASHYLTGSVSNKLQTTFISLIKERGFLDGIENGLLDMIDSLQVTLRGFTLGHTVLIIHLLIMILFGTGLYFYMFFRKVDSDVWGNRYPFAFSDWLIQIVTGIWLVKFTVILIAKISHRDKCHDNLLQTLMMAIFVGLAICCLYIINIALINHDNKKRTFFGNLLMEINL